MSLRSSIVLDDVPVSVDEWLAKEAKKYQIVIEVSSGIDQDLPGSPGPSTKNAQSKQKRRRKEISSSSSSSSVASDDEDVPESEIQRVIDQLFQKVEEDQVGHSAIFLEDELRVQIFLKHELRLQIEGPVSESAPTYRVSYIDKNTKKPATFVEFTVPNQYQPLKVDECTRKIEENCVTLSFPVQKD